LQKVRARADPDRLFTPNPFCVKRASEGKVSGDGRAKM
jgi:hypothetical protein